MLLLLGTTAVVVVVIWNRVYQRSAGCDFPARTSKQRPPTPAIMPTMSYQPSDALRPWPLVSEEEAGEFKIFRVRRTVRECPAAGTLHTFVGLDAPDWINVVALTANGRLLLIEQYRHGTDSITLEIPGGAVDPGEDPATAAARELEEETGYRSSRMELLGAVEPNPAFLGNTCWTFLALGCTADGTAKADPAEEIRVHLATGSDFTALIDAGTIRHALVIAAHDHLQRALARGPEWATQLDPGKD
jgi:8-oxo-dGTP pyrophosphatase MutT (NUDIX family)